MGVATSTSFEELVRRAKASELFTAARLEQELPDFLGEQKDQIDDLARRVVAGEFDNVWFVGAGGSWSSLYSGKYLMDRLTSVPAELAFSYELTWRSPLRLGPRSLVIIASYSGGTEDTLVAMRHANNAGATTVAMTRRRKNPLAEAAKHTIDYASSALYILPLAAITRFVLQVAIGRGESREVAQAALQGMDGLATVIGDGFRAGETEALDQAREFLNSNGLYVVAAGPLYGLGYKFALTVFMENIRVHGSLIESAEVRHGPVEMFERQRADMVFLVGTDESRAMTQRSLAVAQEYGARTLTFDAARYEGLHPLLTPFALLAPLQWFTVHSTLLRGILDLDERVFMGRGILARGDDATWP